MSVYIFTGPTISAEEARPFCAAVYLPPVRQGDVLRVTRTRRPRVIGIIDGYFHQVPSVWHKEILWAMAQGVHVFGSASMGALRAAELADFGMEGVGKIFAAYRDGALDSYPNESFEDDDEVAVVHGPPEMGYLALSEPLVNIRCTLAKAAADGIISTATRDALVCIGKNTLYPNRTYEHMLACAATASLPERELTALRDWLPAGRLNQKREDAVAMLVRIQQWHEADPAPKRISYAFEHTELWDKVYGGETNTVGSDDIASAGVLTELRLQNQLYSAVKSAALLRSLALREAERQQIQATPKEIRHTSGQIRQQFGLLNRTETERWLVENGLNLGDFDRLMADETKLSKLNALTAPSLERHMIDHLRITGEYSRLRDRARRKEKILQPKDCIPPPQTAVPPFELVSWYFENQLGCPLPDDLDTYIAVLGFTSPQEFFQALAQEYLFVTQGDPTKEMNIPDVE